MTILVHEARNFEPLENLKDGQISMKKKNYKSAPKSKVRRERDPIPWKYCILTLLCGFLLVAGFFSAARLHFSSMNFGIENAKLRKVAEQLKSENRQLILDREIAISGVGKAARKLGFQSRTAQNIEVVKMAEQRQKNNAATEVKAENASMVKSIPDEHDTTVEEFETQISLKRKDPNGSYESTTTGAKGKEARTSENPAKGLEARL